MTQNKKKGVAKKALSISLVAAMLATSNVPVWASFEAVDETGFALEETAPVAENEVADSNAAIVGASGVTTEADLNVNFTADKESIVWGDNQKVTVTGGITHKDGGAPVGLWDYAWKDSETGINLVEGKISDGNASVGMSLDAKKELAGKTLTLWVWRSEGNVNFKINTGISVTVEKKALKEINVTPAKTPKYNGFSQNLSEATVVVKDQDDQEVNSDDYTISSTSGTNAGDELIVTATPKDDSAYIGSVDSNVIKIGQKTHEPGDIIASVTEGLKFQYTGSAIAIDKANVSVKESKSENNGQDGKLRGDDFSAYITDAKTSSAAVGTSTVVVSFDGTKVKNIALGNINLTTEETVTIDKRDLTNNTDISLKYGAVAPNSPIIDIVGDLVFKDGDTTINLVNGLDYIVKVTNAAGAEVTGNIGASGTYYMTITATANGNAVGTKSIELPVTGNIVTSVSSSKNYSAEYTGKAIEPTQSDIGNLSVNGTAGLEPLSASEWTITGYKNNVNATKPNKETAKVVIAIKSGSYAGKTVELPFDIDQLTVTDKDITVPETITYNKDIRKAEDYKLPVTVVAKDSKGNKVSLVASDYSVDYEFAPNDKNEINNQIQAVVTILNDNFKKGGTSFTVRDTTIVAKALTDAMIQVNPSSYTYTGGNIIPEYLVLDGTILLYENDEYEAVITDNVNVGTGKIAIKAISGNSGLDYSGTASATFSIVPADVKSVKIEIEDQPYTGKQIRPRMNTVKVTLNGNDVTSQFEIEGYGENIKAGTGTITLKPVAGNKNFNSGSVTGEFNIIQDEVTGELKIYNSLGSDITNVAAEKVFAFDGTEKTFAKAVLNITGPTGTKATADDFEIKYVDNISGKYDANGNNKAYIYAVAKAGSGYTGTEKFTTSDGTVIKGVVDYIEFTITSVKFDVSNVTVKNATYTGGLPVKPEVIVQIGGNTLVEGRDYVLENYGFNTEVTNGKTLNVTVKGIGGYAASTSGVMKWGIDKKNIADCDVTIKDGIVTVMNGVIPVPATEYTTKTNENGSITVTAVTGSKNYTGSQTISVTQAPAATTLRVTDRTTSTVSLAWDKVDGAEGYTIWFRSEYDTQVSRKIINGGDITSWTQNGLQPGTKYFYTIRAWVKTADGYVFSEQSPVQRGTTKPIAAQIKSVSATNGKVKVVLAGKAAGAEMYSMCYSKSADFDNFAVGIRTSYTTRTFSKTLAKGTYFVRVKSYRDLGNNKRVYGAWSNTMTVVVK